MQNKKYTKRALLSSVIALILCCAMLLGTTFAWFTDSASTAKNTIKSGSLDLKVEYTTDGTNWTEVDENTDIFSADLWEPGFTKAGAFRVTNVGTLALKYKMNVNVFKETGSTNMYGKEFTLSDYLVINSQLNQGGQIGDIMATLATMNRGNAQGTGTVLLNAYSFGDNLAEDESLMPGDYQVIIMNIYMPTTVGNEANYDYAGGYTAPTIEFGVNVEATQYTYEEDSFGKDYDENAEYAEADYYVATTAELKDALNNAEAGAIIDAGGETLAELNGYSFKKDVTVRNATFDGDNGVRMCYANGTVVFENCIIDGDVYGAHFDGGSGDVIFKNCVLTGWNSFGSALNSVTFESCTFNIDEYGCVRFYQNAKISNCSFASGFSWIDAAADNITVEITNSGDVAGLLYNNGTFSNVKWIVDGADVSSTIGGH